MSIKDYIIKGAKNAFVQLYLFNYHGESIPSKATEYLFTVNIAQELLNWKENTDEIHLEYAAKKFKQNCFERIKKVSKGFLYREGQLPLRSGRIDIAIIREERSVFAVEVKAINGSNELIKKDLERLIDFLSATDPIGDNSLKECYMVFFKRLDKQNKVYSSEEYERDKKCETEKVKSKISEIINLKGVNVSVEMFDMTKNFVEAYEGINYEPYDQPDYSELAGDTGSVVGILLTLKRE